jgi:hypothetical protein
MKSINKSKIMFMLSIMFFVVGIYVNFNSIYKVNFNNSNNNSNKLISSYLTKDDEQKVLDLLNTMDEGIEYLHNSEASIDTKSQLISNLSDAATVINNKLNYKNTEFIDEVNSEYYNLKYKNTINIDRLSLKYEKWKQNIVN